MLNRFLSLCVVVGLIGVIGPLELLVPIGNMTDPAEPQAVCLYVPPGNHPNQSLSPAKTLAPTSSPWQFEAPLVTARHSFGFVWLPGTPQVYAVGGMAGWEEALSSVEVYDACGQSWGSRAPLPEPRGYVQAAELNGKIVVVGGVDRVASGIYQVHNDTWIYDPVMDNWSAAAPLPQALGGVALAAVNGRLYAFGGFDARGPGAGDVDTTYLYNPDSNTWLTRTAMISGPRSLAGAARLNDKAYVIGGTASGSLGGTAEVDVYDPNADAWRVAPHLLEGVHSPAVTAAPDGSLYALGGGVAWYTFVTAQRYDPVSETWSYLPEVFNDFYRTGSSAVYAKGRLILAGGIERAYDVTTNSVETYRLNDDFCQSDLRADRSQAEPGGRVYYTVDLHSSINSLDHASALISIPAGTSFAGFSANPIGARFNRALNRVEWFGSIAGGHAPLSFTFGVDVNGQGWRNGQSLSVMAFFDSGLGYPFQRTAAVTIDYFELSASTKTVDRVEVTQGENVHYTIRAQNSSHQSSTVYLSDRVPFGLNYVFNSLSSSTGIAERADDMITWSGQLPYHATYTNNSGDYQWGDSHGGGVIPGVIYDWIEISQTGRQMGFYGPSSGKCYPVPIPFGFYFYGTYYTQTGVQIDGSVYFPEANEVGLYPGPNNQPIPFNDPYLNRFIAPLWDDLYLWPGGIYYQVVGTPPNRHVVIEYSRFSRLGSLTEPGNPGDFEVVLYEGSGAIVLQYQDVDFGNPLYDFGASATVGIQGSPTQGVQYSYNTPALSNSLAILFLPPGKTFDYWNNTAEIAFDAKVVNPYQVDQLITNTAVLSTTLDHNWSKSAVIHFIRKAVDPYVAVTGPGTLEPAQPFTYTITYGNLGPYPTLDHAQIVDRLPPNVTYLSSSPGGVYDLATNTLSWETEFLPVNKDWFLTVTAQPNEAPLGSVFTNTVTIAGPPLDTNLSNNTARWFARMNSVPNLLNYTAKTVDPAMVQAGETVTYTIAIVNTGAISATATLTDPLPAATNYITGSSTVDGVPIELYNHGSNSLNWHGSIAAQAGVTLSFQVALISSGPVVNTATINDGTFLTFERRVVLWQHLFLPAIWR